jgi:hypothetical protein
MSSCKFNYRYEEPPFQKRGATGWLCVMNQIHISLSDYLQVSALCMENIALLAATYIKVTNKQFIRRGGRRCRDRMVVEFATTSTIPKKVLCEGLQDPINRAAQHPMLIDNGII